MRLASVGYVYAAFFSDGWVKVGRGSDPSGRIKIHQSSSMMRNATIDGSLISGMLINSKKSEKRLISFCCSAGNPVHGNEWFINVSFELLKKLFESEFSGDSKEEIEERLKECGNIRDEFAKKIVSIGSEKIEEVVSDGAFKDWPDCVAHSKLIEKTLLHDGYCGDIFKPETSGMSMFSSYASFALVGMTDDDRIGMYHMVTEEPDEALNILLNKGSEFLKEFRSGESK